MGLFDAMNVAATGLTGERLRMDTIAANLANANSTRRADGQPGPYLRRQVVLQEQSPSAGRPGTELLDLRRLRQLGHAGRRQDRRHRRADRRHGPDPRPVAPGRRRERQRAHAERQHGRRDDRPDHRHPRVRGQHHLDERDQEPSSPAPWTCCANGHRPDRRRRHRRPPALQVAAQPSAAPPHPARRRPTAGLRRAHRLEARRRRRDAGTRARRPPRPSRPARPRTSPPRRSPSRRRPSRSSSPQRSGTRPSRPTRTSCGCRSNGGRRDADSRYRRRSPRHGLPPDRRRDRAGHDRRRSSTS